MSKPLTYQALEIEVIRWAEDRKIIPHSTPLAQAKKTQEELGELFCALSCADRAETIDAYGDILVTLIIGAALADLDLTTCLRHAYDQIKDRKGYLNEEGIFVKEST